MKYELKHLVLVDMRRHLPESYRPDDAGRPGRDLVLGQSHFPRLNPDVIEVTGILPHGRGPGLGNMGFGGPDLLSSKEYVSN